MKTYMIDGLVFHVGQNAEENESLVLRGRLHPNNLWFHLQHFPSPHGVLHCEGKEVGDDVIMQCATKVKERSKHKNAARVSVSVLALQYVRRDPAQQGSVILQKNPRVVTV